MKRRRGFTLVEIMIVVAIIALLAAIAIPNLLGARRTANEAAAKANIKVLCTEAEVYAAGTGEGAYPASIAAADWKAATAPASVTTYCTGDAIVSTVGKGGYYYTCTLASTGYTFAATRLSANTGSKCWSGSTGGQIVEVTCL